MIEFRGHSIQPEKKQKRMRDEKKTTVDALLLSLLLFPLFSFNVHGILEPNSNDVPTFNMDSKVPRFHSVRWTVYGGLKAWIEIRNRLFVRKCIRI